MVHKTLQPTEEQQQKDAELQDLRQQNETDGLNRDPADYLNSPDTNRAERGVPLPEPDRQRAIAGEDSDKVSDSGDTGNDIRP